MNWDDYILYTAAGLFGFLAVYLPGAIKRRHQHKRHMARFDAMVERYAKEAEEGYDLETLVKKLRKPGV